MAPSYSNYISRRCILLRQQMLVCLMVVNTTFNNVSVLSWRSVLLVEETGGPGENHRPVASHWQTFSHNVVHLALMGLTTSVVIGTDCKGSSKSNYHRSRSRRPLVNNIHHDYRKPYMNKLIIIFIYLMGFIGGSIIVTIYVFLPKVYRTSMRIKSKKSLKNFVIRVRK